MDDIDHRQLGNKLDLFHQQDEGPGMVFWHPRGWELYRVVEDYIRRRMRGAGFREVRTPQLLLKFVLAHPSVTCVIPGTGRPEYMRDNVRAGFGSYPDQSIRQRIAAAVG